MEKVFRKTISFPRYWISIFKVHATFSSIIFLLPPLSPIFQDCLETCLIGELIVMPELGRSVTFECLASATSFDWKMETILTCHKSCVISLETGDKSSQKKIDLHRVVLLTCTVCRSRFFPMIDKCHRGVGVTSKLIKRAFGNEENRNFSSSGSTLGYCRLLWSNWGKSGASEQFLIFLERSRLDFLLSLHFLAGRNFPRRDQDV